MRERVFGDIKNDNLKNRCLDVIQELKLEADTLEEKNRKAIEESQERWADEEGEKDKIVPTLAHIDDDIGGIGVDEEMILKLKEEMFNNIDEKNFKMEQKLTKHLTSTLGQNTDKVLAVEGQLNQIEANHLTF